MNTGIESLYLKSWVRFMCHEMSCLPGSVQDARFLHFLRSLFALFYTFLRRCAAIFNVSLHGASLAGIDGKREVRDNREHV